MQRPRRKTVTLDDIVITEELSRRSPRSPNWQAEAQAMHTLARQMVDRPEIMLQTLVDIALDLCVVGTAGVSELTTTPDGEEVFRPNVLAGALAQYVGGTTPRKESLCGVCLDRGTPVLFSHPERYFTYFQAANTPIVEGLVLPLIADDRALGTIWIISHDENRHFDFEDVRVMTSLADFTAAALLLNQRQTGELLAANAALETEIAERKQAEARARALISNLPGGAAFVVDRDLRYLLAEGEALAIAGFKREDFVGQTIFEVLPPELAANYEPLYRRALAGEPFEHEHYAHDRTYISRGTPLLAENGEIYAVLAVSYDISDRKQAENALRESEERFRLFVTASSSDIVYRMSADWREMYRLVGKNFLVSTEDSSQTWIETYIPPEEQPRVWAAIQSAIDTKSMFELEHRVIQQDGAIGWTFSRAIPMLNERGDIVEWFGTASDVTEHKRSEEALRESEERFRTLANTAPAPIWYNDAQGENRFLNQYFLDFTGKSAEQIRGEGWHNLIHPEDAEDYIADYLLAVREQRSWHNRNRIRRHDGVWRWHENYAQPLFNADGVYLGHVGVTIDNTNAIEAEAALRESEAKYRSLFDSIDEGFAIAEVIYDLSGQPVDILYLEANPAASRLTGVPDFTRRRMSEILPDWEPYWVEIYDRVARSGVSERTERYATLLKRWYDFSVFRLEAVAESSDRRVAVIFQDITDCKRQELALRESEEKFRILFNSINEGFCIMEVVAGERGEITDLYFRQVNQTFEQHTGLSNVVGKTVSELLPNFEQHWIDIFQHVWETGEPSRAENYLADVDRWYQTQHLRIGDAGSPFVAVVFEDISDRKRAEEALRESEEQQTFLLKLSDALRAEPDADAIASRAVRMLAKHLRLERFWLSEVFEQQDISTVGPEYHRPDLPPMSGVFRLSDYPETMRQIATQPMVIHDVASDPGFSDSEKSLLAQLHLRALLVVSLRKGQHQVIWALAAAMTTPRHWNESERGLLEEVGERVWAAIERARAEVALRESEEKYRSLFNSVDEGYLLCDVIFDENEEPIDILYLEANPAAVRLAGRDFSGQRMREIDPNYEDYWYELIGRVALTGESVRAEHYAELHGRWFDFYASRVGGPGSRRVASIFQDTTDRKRREANLAFLAEVSQDLVHLTNIDETMNAIGAKIGGHFNVARVVFSEISEDQQTGRVSHEWHQPDLLDMKGSYKTKDYFSPEFELLHCAGEVAVVHDTAKDERVDAERYAALGVSAFVGVPLIRQNKWRFYFSLLDSKPHDWRDNEIELLRELTTRIWTRLERARAESALRESEAKYRSLFNSIDEGFHIIELIDDQAGEVVDYRFLEGNPAFERLTGLKNTAGKLGSEIAPKTESYWLEAYDQVVRTGEPLRIENYNKETKHWYSTYASPVNGTVSRQVAIIFDDITDRKRAEAQLRRAAEMDAFRLKLADAIRPLTDPDEIIAKVSEIVGRYYNVGRCGYAEVPPPYDHLVVARDWTNGIMQSLQGSLPLVSFGDEMIEQYRTGQTVVVEDAFEDARNQGKEAGLKAAGNIRSSIAVQLVKQGNWVASFYIQDTVRRSWTQNEVDLMEEIADRTWAALERARAESALREAEIQRVREQSAREEARQRAESLVELDRAKTTFFSNVSHEFRTPLTLLLAPLQDALSDSVDPLSQRQRERLELAHRNASRLLKLVNTLLDFSRIEVGRMEAVYEPTDLALFTTELASVFRSAIERAGLRLIVDCPALPESVYVDRQMWEKIVLNLLSNAFKFTLEGEIAVRLHRADSDCIKLQIQDTGTGIAPEELPHLFERFYQIRGAASRTHEGSGIGLALVQELIKMHGGTVEVSSTVGQGTCFTIAIPLGTAHLQSDRLRLDVGDRTTTPRTLASTALGAAPYVEEAERWLPNKNLRLAQGNFRLEDTSQNDPKSKIQSPKSKILLVDDNADMRDYLTRILSEHAQVEAVTDGAAALAAIQQTLPDLVLSDVMMPQMGGFELVNALRADARTREVPIVLLSARAGEESVIEGLLAGADDYLIKPFSATSLVTRVLAHLGMAQLRSDALHQEKTNSRIKDKFLAEVAHELNTPLVAILGWTRLLRSNPFNQSMLSKSLETIERNATLQAKLIEDLLEISRITAGKISLNQEPVELQQAIEVAIASVSQSLKTKDISLECLLDPLPRIVQADPNRLQQIILNLLTNAIKFTPNRGKIEICLEANETQVLIVLTDTGCGIRADELPYIFDTFRQGAGSNKGLGLGLAIARHLARLHDGTIDAASSGIGLGATFTVRLPILQ